MKIPHTPYHSHGLHRIILQELRKQELKELRQHNRWQYLLLYNQQI